MSIEFNKNYFFLNDDCVLIKGKTNGAIYDFEKGDVYSINNEETLILEQFENFESIEKISKNLSIHIEKILVFLQQVQEKGLGNFYERPVYIDKYIEFYREETFSKYIKLDTLIIEPHKRCSLDCIFCTDENGKKNEEYIYCGCRKENNSMILPIDTIKNIINEAKEFSLNSVYFCGGDPFIFKDEILELLKYCKENVPIVIAHTHATNLDEYCIDQIKDLDIHLNIPVYSYDEKIHDYIVNVNGNYKKLITVLKMLLGKGINFEAILYISEFNISNVKRTVNFFKNLGCKVVIQKFIYPVYEALGKKERRFLRFFNNKKFNFPKINKNTFLINKNGNVCLSKKVAINSNGNIIPCHIANNEITGNIKDVSLNNIIRKGKMDFYWNLSKDKLMPCNQCEYRYVCFNCPILEHRKVNQEFKENMFCKYNPINGKMEI